MNAQTATRWILRLLLAVAVGAWTTFMLAGTQLFVLECRPELVEAALGMHWLVLAGLGAAVATLWRARAAGLMLRGSLFVGAGSGLLLLSVLIEATRGAHGWCAQVGHWTPGHQHVAHPAGDVGALFVLLLAVGGALVGLVLAGIGCIAAWLVARRTRRHRAEAEPRRALPQPP